MDFVTYWLPSLQEYRNVLLYFVYDPIAVIEPEPDVHYAIYMYWKRDNWGLASIEEPDDPPVLRRDGYYALEWGGAEIK